MEKAKKLFIITLKVCTILLFATIIAVFLLNLVYLIPVENIYQNAKISSDLLLLEGDYKNLSLNILDIFGNKSYQLDNFTDAIMISEAVVETNTSAIDSAMMNFMNGGGVSSLARYFEGDITLSNYSRYWHGYLVFLKPLLLIFNLKTIRILNLVLQLILILIMIYAFWKKARLLLLPYLISIILINPFVISQSLQFSTMYYLFNFALLFTLCFYERLKLKNSLGYLFLIFGIITCFFDFLTYPLTTLTMPLVIVMWFDDNKTIKAKFLEILKLGIFWAIGYFGFWSLKWIVGSVLTGENLIIEALKQAQERTIGEVSYDNENLRYFAFLINIMPYITLKSIILCVVSIIFVIVINCRYKNQIQKSRLQTFAFLFISIIQVCWFLVLSNHSFVHYWFTFRAYIGSIFAILALIAYKFKNVNCKRNMKEKTNEEKNSSALTML